MKNFCTFEQSKLLYENGYKFEKPSFGDVFYTIHPDTGKIDNVVVGSALWHISAMLPMFRAPSLIDLLCLIGNDYTVRYDINNATWTLERQIFIDFTSDNCDYITHSIPVKTNKCCFSLIVDFLLCK